MKMSLTRWIWFSHLYTPDFISIHFCTLYTAIQNFIFVGLFSHLTPRPLLLKNGKNRSTRHQKILAPTEELKIFIIFNFYFFVMKTIFMRNFDLFLKSNVADGPIEKKHKKQSYSFCVFFIIIKTPNILLTVLFYFVISFQNCDSKRKG